VENKIKFLYKKLFNSNLNKGFHRESKRRQRDMEWWGENRDGEMDRQIDLETKRWKDRWTERGGFDQEIKREKMENRGGINAERHINRETEKLRVKETNGRRD